MNTVPISVTQEDISKGLAGNCHMCPIAIAAQRAFPNLFPVITCTSLYLDSGPDTSDGVGMLLPEKARQFIDAFDLRQPVEPFEFTVIVP